MNIFLPYENDVNKSVQSLCDLRLNKQILECYQLFKNALKEKNEEEVKGYKNHPIYVHYKSNIEFLAMYGLCCCREYYGRFHKTHKLEETFIQFMWGKTAPVEYTPFYMQGSKGQLNYIRTTENVSELYQKKLCEKWENDKAKGRPPKWTNRDIPSFYKENTGEDKI